MERIEDCSFFNEGTVLLADASGELMSVCAAKDGKVLYEERILGGALENFFSMLKTAINNADIPADKIDAFGFCRGTGSILGIRIVSAAFSSLRALNTGAKVFTWDLLDCYAQLLKPEAGDTFSIACPSRKNYANVLVSKEGSILREEVPSEKVAALPCPKYFIRQRNAADKNFEGLEEAFFSSSQIFGLLKQRPEFGSVLAPHETADALTLAKREYAKWNFQAHS